MTCASLFPESLLTFSGKSYQCQHTAPGNFWAPCVPCSLHLCYYLQITCILYIIHLSYIRPLCPVFTSPVCVFVFGKFVVFVFYLCLSRSLARSLSLSLSLSLSVCMRRICIQKRTRGWNTCTPFRSPCTLESENAGERKKNRGENRTKKTGNVCAHPTNLVSAMMLGF